MQPSYNDSRWPRPHYDNLPPKKHMQETTFKMEKIQVERKTFSISLKENERGRFLRITEEAGGRFAQIIVPIDGLAEFQRIFTQLAEAKESLPPEPPQALS